MKLTTHLYEYRNEHRFGMKRNRDNRFFITSPNHTTIHFAFRWWLIILLLFLKTRTGCQGCELSIEVYESRDDCLNGGDSIGSGRIVADGTCRETSSVSPSSVEDLLPGIYRAVCDGSDRVTFQDSGCDDRSCSRSDRGVCDGDNSVESYIYARVDRDSLRIDTCYILEYNNSDGDVISVSFYIYGNCDSSCRADDEPETDPPVPDPTRRAEPSPTDPPETDEPVAYPTDPPEEETDPPEEETDPPETDEPVASPTDPPVPSPTEPPEPAATDPPVPPPTDPPQPEPKPQPQPEPEPQPQPEPEPQPQPQPEPEPDPQPAPPPTRKPQSPPTPIPEPPPAPKPVPPPTRRPRPPPTPQPAPSPTRRPRPPPTPQPLEPAEEPTDATDSPTPQPLAPEEEPIDATDSPTIISTTTAYPRPAPTDIPEVSTNSQPTSEPSRVGASMSIIQASLQFSPLETRLPDDDDTLETWVDLTEQFITEQAVNNSTNNLTSIQLEISGVSQTVLMTNAARRQRRQLQQQPTLNISFDLLASDINASDRLDQIFESVFDSESERGFYLERLKDNALLSDYFDGVTTVTAKTVAMETGSNQDSTDGDDAGNGMGEIQSDSGEGVNTIVDKSNDSAGSSSVAFIAVALVAVALSAVLVGLFVWRRYYRTNRVIVNSMSSSNPSSLKQEGASFSVQPLPISDSSQQQQQESQQQQYTNDLLLTAPFDEVSTLSGKQHATTESGVFDDPTATVDLENFPYEYTQTVRGAAASSDDVTVLSRLSRLLVINDESKSFEALFARDILDNASDEGVKVQPFILEVEPDTQLGLVVETNGGLPAVRAIRNDSPFHNQVQVGDILIAVNEQDVTNMTALEVSELIKSLQCLSRTLVFIRPETKLQLLVHQADF